MASKSEILRSSFVDMNNFTDGNYDQYNQKFEIFNSDSYLRKLFENYKFPYPIDLIHFANHDPVLQDSVNIENLLSQFQIEISSIKKTQYIVQELCESIFKCEYEDLYTIIRSKINEKEIKNEWTSLFILDREGNSEEIQAAIDDYLSHVKFNVPDTNWELNSLDDLFSMHILACSLNIRLFFVNILSQDLLFTQPIGSYNAKYSLYVLFNPDKTFSFLQPSKCYSKLLNPKLLENANKSKVIDRKSEKIEITETTVESEPQFSPKQIQNLADKEKLICVKVFDSNTQNWNRMRYSEKFLDKIIHKNQPIIIDRPEFGIQKLPIYADILCLKSIYDYMFLDSERHCTCCNKIIQPQMTMIPTIKEGSRDSVPSISFCCYECACKMKTSFFDKSINYFPQIFKPSTHSRNAVKSEETIKKTYEAIKESFENMRKTKNSKQIEKIFNLLKNTIKYINGVFVQFADSKVINNLKSINDVKCITTLENTENYPLLPSIFDEYISQNPIEREFCPYSVLKSPQFLLNEFSNELQNFDSDVQMMDLMKQGNEIRKFEISKDFKIVFSDENSNELNSLQKTVQTKIFNVTKNGKFLCRLTAENNKDLLDVYSDDKNILAVFKEDEIDGFATLSIYLGLVGTIDISKELPVIKYEKCKFQKGLFLPKSSNLYLLCEKPESMSLLTIKFGFEKRLIVDSNENDEKIKDIAAGDEDNVYEIVQTDVNSFEIFKVGDEESVCQLKDFDRNNYEFFGFDSFVFFKSNDTKLTILNGQVLDDIKVTTNKSDKNVTFYNSLFERKSDKEFYIISNENSRFLPQKSVSSIPSLIHNGFVESYFAVSCHELLNIVPKENKSNLFVFVLDSNSTQFLTFVKTVFGIEISLVEGISLFISNNNYLMIFYEPNKNSFETEFLSLIGNKNIFVCAVKGPKIIKESISILKEDFTVIYFENRIKSISYQNIPFINGNNVKNISELKSKTNELDFKEISKSIKKSVATYAMLNVLSDIPHHTVLDYCEQSFNYLE
ncbi:hypothetical protein TVAG_343100 [Trichomonas vaginalis G3]|uniref:Uncharacterized protein n=1 Tax=Trichomonas vaginalis (strain ATCC PRA-98 / G3) TaxID=412133 RepID=A2EJS2_TRIV3|nr:hypothetical protein TVAGG3_0579940 [Trichomonas vaginalis G3]EAY07146.1 hypothetical protein TVAG_343100 [Trichomonas vaginalis G3]KAI5522501.1 hypothetical protein TVAGG3_0579940 [Trichomonas vaginalis G3]|eukprot:XP_001319369.1 hypothetical protein [Trichomonas vaginalis G3]